MRGELTVRHLPLIVLILEVLGLLLLAAGACAAAWTWIGPSSFAVAGAVVLGGTYLAEDAAEARGRSRERTSR